MAGTDRQQNIDIENLLLKHGQKIGFVQVLRLLRFLLISRKDHPGTYQNVFENIRIRPDLNLEFPGTDVVLVEQLERRKKHLYRVTAAFMGLYGPSSPLPTFYTEDLIEERREDGTITRDFLDVINHPFYQHYFEIWDKYSIGHQLAEDPQSKVFEFLYSLLGLSGENVRQSLSHSRRFLAYIGIASQRPRSASGLRSIIAHILSIDEIEVEQCVPYIAQIDTDQQLLLGIQNSSLGDDAHLGSQLKDLLGKFRLRFGPLSSSKLQQILPDTDDFGLLCETVLFYLDQPLMWDIEIEVEHKDIQTSQTGNSQWGKLGWNTWLFSGESVSNAGFVPLTKMR